MTHLQFHPFALLLHVILKIHHNKWQKLLHNHKDINSTTTRVRITTWICTSKSKRKKKLLDLFWEHFIKEEDGWTYCKHYNASYSVTNSIHGTSNLRIHVFQKNPHMHVDKKQKTIVFGNDSESDPTKISMKLVDFNQEQTLI